MKNRIDPKTQTDPESFSRMAATFSQPATRRSHLREVSP
jgi:hypothetical protein